MQYPAPMFPDVDAGELTASAGYGGAPDGLGFTYPPPVRTDFTSAVPVLRDLSRVQRAMVPPRLDGLGQHEVPLGLAMTFLIGGLVIRGAAGYFAGKAMAPRGRESKYAWGGAVAGGIFGTIGLGVTGAIALSNK